MRHGGHIIGYISWYDLGDHVFVRQYMIERAYRGRGLGSALLARLRAEVLPPEAELRLEASADRALRFWMAQGFAPWSTGLRLASPEDSA